MTYLQNFLAFISRVRIASRAANQKYCEIKRGMNLGMSEGIDLTFAN